jgi:predicted dehydrogenase
MNIAFVGCGYVAGLYAGTLGAHPTLKLVGAYDADPRHLEAFRARWPARAYASLEEVLADPGVALVLNLTNPRSHFAVTRDCLAAGKHVYSEKPLAMSVIEARSLALEARQRGLVLACAPCSLLSPAAQAMWKALRDGAIGRVRLVYGNFDDGMIAPRQEPWNWRNDAGVAWPARDEFEVGATYEHAGYVLTWLAAFFGPAQRVTAFASTQIPDKGIEVASMAPDFSVGCVEYGDGVVARITCGLVAPRDKSMTIVGDDGVLFVGNVRDDHAPVYLRRARLSRWQAALARRTSGLDAWLAARFPWPGTAALFQERVPAAAVRGAIASRSKPVDFLRGPAEVAAAIAEGRPCRLTPELGVHVVELIEALQYPGRHGHHKALASTFPAITPITSS